MTMFVTGYVYNRGSEDWTTSISNLGTATMAVGAGIIVWRAVVRSRRRGPVAAVLAGVGGLGLALLLAVAAAAVALGVLINLFGQ
jgi:hypothetical protein